MQAIGNAGAAGGMLCKFNYWGRAHQPKSGHINDFERLLSLIQRTKKNTPMTAAIRKAEITLAHHASRESNFSGSGRSVASLHQLCQVLMCQSTRDKVKTPKQSKVFALALPSISRTAAHRIKFYACIYIYIRIAHVLLTPPQLVDLLQTPE